MKKQAKWIKSPVDEGSAVQSFRKTLAVSKPVKRATLMASAMGVYVPTVNGQRVGESVLMPGWTHYGKRVQYQKYDVTRLISPTTVLELSVGTGWAAGSMGGMRYDLHNYVDHTSVAAQLTLVYTDGTTEEYFTDESWDVYSSPVRYADIYHGETVDLTHPVSLLGAAVETEVKARMIAQVGEDITEQERLAPVEIIRTPRGETVVDFGQNMTGYVELRISANQGDRIVFTHAEVLDREGNFYTDNYRTAKNCMTYVCSGGEDVFKPQYSFQGFRYIRLEDRKSVV